MGSLKTDYIDAFYARLNRDRERDSLKYLCFVGAKLGSFGCTDTHGYGYDHDRLCPKEEYYDGKFIGKYMHECPMFACRGAGDARVEFHIDFPTTGCGGGPWPPEYIAELEKKWHRYL